MELKILELKSQEISKKGEEDSFIHNLKVEMTNSLEKEKEKAAAKTAENRLLEKRIAEMDKIAIELRESIDNLQTEKQKLQEELVESKQMTSGVSEDKSKVEQKLQ